MTAPTSNSRAAIALIVAGIVAISLNDVAVKALSGAYPLHQIVFARSALGICLSLIIVQMEGGMGILRTKHPGLHLLRGLLIVVANMTFFAALAALPLAETTALFFVSPLMITLLSIPLLGERVGPFRLGAVLVGFLGVLIMQRPWAGGEALDVSRFVLLLPVLAALTYALNQIMTRRLGVHAQASALAVYVQATFVAVSLGFFVVAGDGRFADGVTDPSLQFLLRAWIWPDAEDWWVFGALGVLSAIVGYCLSQAYRLADAGVVAPYEYVGLPLAVFWGFVMFGDLPVWEVWIGMVLILGAGIVVYIREQRAARRLKP